MENQLSLFLRSTKGKKQYIKNYLEKAQEPKKKKSFWKFWKKK